MSSGAKRLTLKAEYYQQFDMDFACNVPAEGAGGWAQRDVTLSVDHTAVVVMHAWDTGTREQFPGWHRVVEYIPRADRIVREVFPPLLEAVRRSPLRLFHVVGGSSDYYTDLPGYRRTCELDVPPPNRPAGVAPDETWDAIQQFRQKCVLPGLHNVADIDSGFRSVGFPPEARPLDGEYIASTSEQLLAVCRATGVNHLVYIGFAINGCLVFSPAGMLDMSRYGLICSTLRQAVTAIENKETARHELAKQIALWQVSIMFGLVFDVDRFTTALRNA
ncbi:hypothetical protein ACERK3_14690 [Phycisphaerales bacterium AB-hyl4]|uniref:Isochorismatase-like domain-containing protein n=1 Tax=Natronomicrosphaera hydrolytica TaxID=3242702 RepID=A0ABV4U9P9_9BACT